MRIIPSLTFSIFFVLLMVMLFPDKVKQIEFD